jgi:hypothetical protein
MVEKKRRGRSKRRPTKDRVLQARIPEHLDEELRDRAEQLGLSVSTVVRNVLLNTFDLVEGVVADSAQIGRALQGRGAPHSLTSQESPISAPPPRENETPVVGWQEAILNLNGICEQCNAILPKGELLCLECLQALSSEARPDNTADAPLTRPSGPTEK